uniref:ATP synthase subunit a n=1 Tax=Asellus aquaticus TaxID=92525 RepID=E3SX74_ASEAQ|nr:ATP synthase F0 subunit 6 [Asellus aquaticus]
MMTNLFSIFDPAPAMGLSLNWCSSAIGLLILPPAFYLFNSYFISFWSLLFNYLNKEIAILLPHKSKHFLIVLLSLFTFIMFNYSLGLFPQIFTASSHLVFTLSLALPLWLAYYSYGWVNKFKYMMAHLVPSGTPSVLIPFMVVIESVSSLIRPLTLAIRLAANMIAGHLLMALLSNYASIFSSTMILTVVSSQVLLLILEAAVALIQAYVFMVLSVLYISEI